VTHTRSSSRKRLLPLSRLTLSLLSVGVGATASAAAHDAGKTSVTREVLVADSTAMVRLFQAYMSPLPAEQARPSMPLDLSDPAQYDFVLHRLRAAGNTPANSPRLFANLDKARALARRGGEPTKAQRSCLSFITLEEQALPGTVEFHGASQVSCFGNDGYLFSDLSAFQADAERRNLSALDRRTSEEYGTHVGASERASLSFTYRYEKERLLQFDSLALAFDKDSGAALATYTTAATSGLPDSPGVSSLQDPGLTLYHPVDLINGVDPTTGLTETVIRMCLNRGLIESGNIDCDYSSVVNTGSGYAMYPLDGDYDTSPLPIGLAPVAPVASTNSGTWVSGPYPFVPEGGGAYYDSSNTYIPLRFTYDAGANAEGPCTITSYEPSFTQAMLNMVQADSPACGVAAGDLLGTASLMDYLTTGAQTTTLRKLMDFGPICVDYERSVKLTVRIGARATCGTTPNLLRFKTYVVSPIQYRNSCFAQGTRVVRANGESAAIENFKVGDKLLANDKGLVLTVTGVSRGVEKSAMVRLQDDQGHEALITQTHPVVTANRGVVRAEELKVNDQLVTREGTSVLTRLTRELYKGTVYNLAVGTPEELAKADPESRTLYAGGLRMGDYHMQAELDARRAKPSAAQASIPSGWLVDYVNDQAHQK
jgi:hypothetical protein